MGGIGFPTFLTFSAPPAPRRSPCLGQRLDFLLGLGDGLFIERFGLLQILDPLIPPGGLLLPPCSFIFEGARLFRCDPLALFNVHGPGKRAIGPAREQCEEIVEVLERKRSLLPYLDIGQVVVPDLPRGLALGEEEKIGLAPAPAAVNTPAERLMMHHKSQPSSNFRLVLTKASWLVRKSNPSSRTIPHRPPSFK